MEWLNRAACKDLDTNLFINPSRKKYSDQDLWSTNLMCRECPVNLQCLTYALDNDLEYGLYGLPERVRRRIRNKDNLKAYMVNTFKTMDVIDPTFNKEGKLINKRCLRCHRYVKGYSKDNANWGGFNHICVSCYMNTKDKKRVDKLLDRDKASQSMPIFDHYGALESKKCTKCQKRQPADNFSNRKAGIGGKTSWCKKCTLANLKKWLAKKKKNEET